MKSYTHIMIVWGWIVCLSLAACSNQTAEQSQTDNITDSNFTKPNSDTTYSLTLPKDELAQIYTLAIAEFIKGVYKKDKTTFDTLFFWKHVYGQPDDFPDIILPETIENTHVRIISPDVKPKENEQHTVYINMMGWLNKEQAEFVLVVFSNGFEHQYDYFINFAYNSIRKEFALGKIDVENYQSNNGQKTTRKTIYKDGKYVADK